MNKPSIFEPAIMHEAPTIFSPTSFGPSVPSWSTSIGVTMTSPALGAGFTTQFPRTNFIGPGGIANLEIGTHPTLASDRKFWRGNAASRGGFYFSARFFISAAPSPMSIRMFVGLYQLVGSGGNGVCQAASSAVGSINSVGLWFDDTDLGSMSILTIDGTGGNTHFTKTPMLLSNGTPLPLTISLNTVYEFVMICNPNQNVIVTYLVDVLSQSLLRTQNVGATMPAQTAFMAPQAGLSNSNNLAGNDTSFDLIGMYARPNLTPFPVGSP
jgi:hypothetical protein